MKLTIRITRTTITFTAPNTVIEGQTDYEQYNMKTGIAVAANLRQALTECHLPQAKRPSHLTPLSGGANTDTAQSAVSQAESLYDDVLVVIDTPLLLIPQEEFDVQNVALLYAHTNSNMRQDEVLTYPIAQLGVVAAYAVNRDLRFVLSETFRGVQYMPLLAPVLVQFSQQSWGGFQEKLFCYFHDKRIDICAFRKGKVRFCNSFDATLAPDAAYYILNVWQTLAMKRTDILCLSGNISGLEQLVKELGRFIKNIKHVH